MAVPRVPGPREQARTGRRSPPVVRLVVGLVVVAQLALVGCSAGEPRPRPTVTGSRATAPPTSVAVPADGRLLRGFGYRYGPLGSFSLPRTAVLVTSVDQPDNVTAVLSAPGPEQVAAYLRRALPEAGYTITADDPGTSTLTFAGPGWTGSFTGSDAASAVVLRPA